MSNSKCFGVFVLGLGVLLTAPAFGTEVAHWTMDDCIIGFCASQFPAEEIVNGNHAVRVNGGDVTDGVFDEAWVFDGNHLVAADDDDLDFGTGDFSISLWVKAYPNGENMSYLLYKSNSSGAAYSVMISDDGRIMFFLRDSNNNYNTFWSCAGSGCTEDFYDGRWYHIALSVNRTSGILNMYLDGDLVRGVSPFSFSGSLENSAPLVIGTNPIDASYGLYGQLDDVRFYDHALTSVEVSNLVNDASSGACCGPPSCIQSTSFLTCHDLGGYWNSAAIGCYGGGQRCAWIY